MNHPLALIKFLFIEESCTTTIHSEHHLITNEALVVEEKEQAFAMSGEGVDVNFIPECLSTSWKSFHKSHRAIEQAIDTVPPILKIDSKVADQHQVTLARFDSYCPRNALIGCKPSIFGDVVLRRNAAWFKLVGLCFQFSYPSDK